MKSGNIIKQAALSIALYASLYFAFFTDISKAFYVTVLFRDVYIPVVGWICIALYAVAWSRISGERAKKIASWAILLGMSAHLPILLCKLNVQLSAPSPIAIVYIYYIRFVTMACLSALAGASLYVAGRAISGSDGKARFFIPLVLLTPHIFLVFFKLNVVMTLSTLIFGAILYYLVTCRREEMAAIPGTIRSILANERTWVIIIFLIGFLLRLFFAIQMLKKTGGGSTFIDGSDDGRTYDQIGWAIAQNTAQLFNGTMIPSAYDPGYSLFLALIYKIFGHNLYAVTFIQSAINGLVPVVTFYIGKTLFSRQVGILASLLLAFDQASIMHSIVLGTEALFTVLLTSSFLFLIRTFKEPQKKMNSLLTGIFLGLSIITRYLLAMMPIFFFVTALFIKGWSLRNKIFKIIIISLIALACILPITALNYYNTHQFYLVERTGSRIDVVWYNSYTGREDMCPSNMKFVQIGFDPFRKPLDSIVFIFKKPVVFAGMCAEIWSKRLMTFLFWPNFGYSDPIMLVNPSKLANEFGSTMEFYFFLVYLVGLCLAVKQVEKERAVLVIFMAISYFIFIHVILFMFSTVRYRVPVIPHLYIIFAVGLYAIYRFVDKGLKGR